MIDTILWGGTEPFPHYTAIPMLDRVTHVVAHRATSDHGFLHGAAIVAHDGELVCGWANSPVDENSTKELMRGRRSVDRGRHWGPIETIAPGFDDDECHSHGVFLSHEGSLWAFVPRFRGLKNPRQFNGLRTEAFVCDPSSAGGAIWSSRGVVCDDLWPLEEPRRLPDGSWIIGGLDPDSNPVVARSEPDNLLRWQAVPIPTPDDAMLRFAETTTVRRAGGLLAVSRYPAGRAPTIDDQVALVSTSEDWGATWSRAVASNLPMVDSKPFAGVLSTGDWYLVFNAIGPGKRDTLVIGVGRQDAPLDRVWRIQHGSPPNLRHAGWAKSSQWSYPGGCEHEGELHVVYSIGKEDCGLSIIPVEVL